MSSNNHLQQLVFTTQHPSSAEFISKHVLHCSGICDLSTRTKTLVFVLFLYCAYFLTYRNHLHQDSNPRQIIVVVLAQTNNCAILLFCLASKLQKSFSPGLGYRNFLGGGGVLAFLPVISLSKQLWSWCYSSILLSF